MQKQISKNLPASSGKVRLGEYALVKGGKRLPVGNSVLDEETNHPYLRIVDMREDGLDVSKVKYISEDVFKKISHYTISDKDLYISIAGTIGLVGKIPYSLSGANLTENCAKICNFSEELDRDFLLYFLRSSMGKSEIKAGTGGSSQPKLALNKIENFQVPLFPVGLQRSIASILSAFDDKIEVNNKIAKTLQDLAQALFKEWFVKFKFPGYEKVEFVDSEFGRIPKGWEVGLVNDLGRVVTGKTPSTEIKENFGSEIPFITIPDMNNVFITKTERCLSEKGSEKMQSMLLPAGSISVSCIATVGLVGITTQLSLTNQQINSIVPNKKELIYFLYIYFKNKKKDLELFGSGGTATLIINKTKFENLDLIIPHQSILKEFHSLVKPMYEKIFSTARENQKLAALRDLLLPKLMRGEIRVNS